MKIKNFFSQVLGVYLLFVFFCSQTFAQGAAAKRKVAPPPQQQQTQIQYERSAQEQGYSSEDGRSWKKCLDPETEEVVNCNDGARIVGDPQDPSTDQSESLAAPAPAPGPEPQSPTAGTPVVPTQPQPTEDSTAATPPPPQTAGMSKVEAEIEKTREACQKETKEIKDSCNPEKDDSLGESISTVRQVTDGITRQLGGAIQDPCSQGIKAFQGGMQALDQFSNKCTSKYNSCVNACQRFKDKIDTLTVSNLKAEGLARTQDQVDSRKKGYQDDVKDFVGICATHKKEATRGSSDTSFNLQSMVMNAQACSSLKGMAQVPQICQQNPNLAACGKILDQNCGNAQYAALTPVCVCRTNPMDPKCSQYNGMSQKTGSGVEGGGFEDPSKGLIGGSGGGNIGGLSDSELASLMSNPPNLKPDGGGAGEDIGGKKGGRGLDPGNGFGGGPKGGQGGAGAPVDPMQIYSGSRGGGGGYYGGSGGTSAPGSRSVAGGGSGSAYPDLSKFRPDMAFQPGTRGLAGVSGSDGITGPHSNIWQKISNRYRYVQSSLMP